MTATVTGVTSVTGIARLRDLRWAVEEFHAAYADVLDRGAVEQWPDFFTDDATYRVIARDNLEAGMPLALMLCEGKGMLKDRAFAIANTEMFAPRYIQHQISLVRVTAVAGSTVSAEANYVIYETLTDEPTKLLQAGRYRDTFVEDADRLLLKDRLCVFDTIMVPNCVVYPV